MGIGNGNSMPGGLVLTGYVGKSLGMGATMGLTDTGWKPCKGSFLPFLQASLWTTWH